MNGEINMSTSNSTANSQHCPICGESLYIYTCKGGTLKVCDKCHYHETLYTNPLGQSNLPTVTNPLVNEPNNKPGGMYGWICPKCGAVMSPYESFCPNCTKRNWEITCTTTGAEHSTDNNLNYNFESGM